MAWFNKKKSENGENGGEDVIHGETPAYEVQSDKAKAWFERAQYATDTHNYEYAVTCYLTGLKFDPTSLNVHERLLEVANLYIRKGGKAATSKQQREMLGDKRPVDKLTAYELAWVTDVLNPSAALKFTQQAAALSLDEVAYWAGDLGARAALRAKKRSKSMLVGFVDVFEEIGGHDKAVEYGEIALSMDRSDAHLDARIRNLSARDTMDKGGYEDNVGQEGGYRSSVRNLDKQKELTDNDSYAVGDEAALARLNRAKDDWEADRDSQDAITRYADLLRKEGTDEHDTEAIKVLLNGYKQCGQYRFRMIAGDIKLAKERRKLRALKEANLQKHDPEENARIIELERRILEHEAREYEERVDQYPTDLGIKFKYGEILFKLDRYNDAIPLLQQAHEDARFRAKALYIMGLAFLKIEWLDEAIESLRQAVDLYEYKDDDYHLGIRYHLMDALEKYARDNNALEQADEASKIASGIAMKQLTFRDIQARRSALKELIKEIKNPG